MDVITAALAAGAAAGLADVATQSIKDAYEQLKAAISSCFPQLEVEVLALETLPDSQAKRSSLVEAMAEAGAQHNGELLRLAAILLDSVARDAPNAAVRAGVDLEQIRVDGTVEIKDVDGDDTGVHGRDWRVGGDIHIRGARGGQGPNR